MARGRDDLDRVMEELLAVLHDDELILEDVEILADGLHHAGQGLLVALRLREVRVRAAPEVILFLKKVDLGVRKRRLVAIDEAVEVVRVRMTEDAGHDLVRRDADLAEPLSHPTKIRIGVTFTKAGIDEGDFLPDLEAHDVDVQRQRIEAFAIQDHGILHHRTVSLRPHEIQALPEEHVPITNGKGFDFADFELVDERIGRTLRGRRLRSFLSAEAHVHGGEAGQSEGGGAQEFTARSRLRLIERHAAKMANAWPWASASLTLYLGDDEETFPNPPPF